MANLLDVEIDLPCNRWIRLSVRTDLTEVELFASSTPRDSVSDLAGALSLLLKGGSQATVLWNEEPSEHEFQYQLTDSGARLTVERFPDGHRSERTGETVMVVAGSVSEICLPFWRALQRLERAIQPSAYEAAWGHPFPASQVRGIAGMVARMDAYGS